MAIDFLVFTKKGVPISTPMKKIQFLTFTILLVSTFFLPTRVVTAQLKATLEGHTDNIWSVAFRPNGVMLASASWDQTVRLWNVKTGRLLHTLTGHTSDVLSVVFSPDGQTLASGSWDGTIRLWNPNNGKLKKTLTEHTGGVTSVAFSPNGRTLVSGSADQTVRLWNTTTWKVKSTLRGHTDIVDAVAFSPNGNMVASGSRDGTIRLWNPNTGEHEGMLKGHTGDIRIAFTPDSNMVASGSRDGTIRLWNPNTGEHKRTLTTQREGIHPVVFSPDGGTLLIGGRGISVWDTQTEEYKVPFAGNIGTTLCVVFSPDGQMVASGSVDNKIQLWEFDASDYEIPSIDTNGMVRLVYFLPNDRPTRPDRILALRQLIKETQQFFADEMERHGFGRKTFTVETDKDGEPLVHRVDGKFTDDYYYQPVSDFKIWPEVNEHFNDPQHVYFIAIDLGDETLNGGAACGLGGVSFFNFSRGTQGRLRDETQGEEILGGFAIIPVSGHCFEDNRGGLHKLRVTTHELGHAFGLDHDFRDGREDAVLGGRGYRLSKCAAEWLSVSRFFNTKPISSNTPGEIQFQSIQIYNQDVISLRFKVTDPDGLHQAQLLLPAISEGTGSGPYRLFDCKRLDGKTSTIETTVRRAELADRVTLQIMDMNGNVTWATLPIALDETVPAENALDVNSDGIIDLLDLTYLGARFGKRGQNSADVNEDKVVDITDLLLVAASMSSVSRRAIETFSAADVQKWLTDVRQIAVENEFQQKGIFFLEYLLREIILLSKPTKAVTGPLKAIFEGHTDFVGSLAFSPDGQTLASGSWDTTIRLWNSQTLRHETTLIGHSSEVSSIAFSPDGQTLASGSWDRTVRLWDPSTGQLKRTLSGYNIQEITSIAFSPDGQILAGGVDSSSRNHTIHLWDTSTGHYKTNLPGHTEQVTFIAFSPDGQILASGSEDNTVRLWNPNTGETKKILTGHTQSVESVAFSRDGQTLASGSRDGTIRLWNPQTGKLKTTLTGYTDWVSPLAFSPDGEILAGSSPDQRIRLWNAKTHAYKNTLQQGAGHLMAIVFSPDGEMLASGREDGTVRLWDVQTLLEVSLTLEPIPNKITGPWLWMIAPTKAGQGGANSTDVDSLADASGGNVTEANVAANGAKEGDTVGNYVWTLGEISPAGGDNINEVLNHTGISQDDVDDHSSYALITLESATVQSDVTMHVGSDDSIKVWLNSEVVHNNPTDRGAEDYLDKFTVDLKQGDNLLLVKVSEREGGWSMFVGIEADVNAVYKRPTDPVVPEDVNGDGVVNLEDTAVVQANLGQKEQNDADVNGDGIVDVEDLLLVLAAIEAAAGAPALHTHAPHLFTAAEVQRWLIEAKGFANKSLAHQRGILMLEQLLLLLTPKETLLLPNYPNPFNPETWLPYQLAKPANITLTIYAVNGEVVCTLALGHQPAGVYESKSRAAYWDGRNAVGERVASGIYFYQLTTPTFQQTRRLVIVK